MRNAKTVTCFKNKRDGSDCNNYRGIGLLSVAGKVFARVFLNRIYPESQYGSWLEQLIWYFLWGSSKKNAENSSHATSQFDLSKAFDLVSHSSFFKILQRIGYPPTLLSFIDITGTVSLDGKIESLRSPSSYWGRSCPQMTLPWLATLTHGQTCPCLQWVFPDNKCKKDSDHGSGLHISPN